MKKFQTLGLAAALALVGTAPLVAGASPNDWRGYGGGGRISGTIASVDGGSVHLQNGRTIFLKDGTVISPSGRSLQAGEQISVNGSNAGDGNVNAQSIVIGGYANGGYRSNGYGNGNRRYDDNNRRYDDNNRRYDDNNRRYDENNRRHDADDANRRRRNDRGDRNSRDDRNRDDTHRDDDRRGQ